MADEIFPDDSEIISQFLEGVKENIVSNAETQNRVASGQSIRELRIETDDHSGKLIDGAGYTYWGWEYGRRPGLMPPRAAIEQWIEDKGIVPQGITKQSLAFLIQRKIGREGTDLFQQGGNSGVISEAITRDRLDALRTAFGSKYLTMIKTEILKAFT